MLVSPAISRVCQQKLKEKEAGGVHAGRVQTILLFRLIGINLLGFMGLYPEFWPKLGVIIPVYLVRTAIINSAYPLQKSVLMDYVPKVGLLGPAMHASDTSMTVIYLSAASDLHTYLYREPADLLLQV